MTITQEDIAGLIAVAQFLEALEIETDAPNKLRDLAQRLSLFVTLPDA